MSAERALVLGGGGIAGAAWMTGLLRGLAEAGQDVTGADLVVGTSAGSTVAAQLGSGLPLSDLYARQTDPALQSREIAADVNFDEFGSFGAPDGSGAPPTPEKMLLAAGAFALSAKTVPEADRRAVIASRLPFYDWPGWPLKLTAVDCESGELRVFDASSGVSLVDAVAASCAVPGVWPPVTIGGRRYMDGGVRSMDNADLAAGYASIVVISPFGMTADIPSPLPLADVVARLESGGSAVTVISPDEASVAAFGENPLDPSTRGPAAAAGLAQGRRGL
jgi:NTE family protein